jgi:hypothetical protein
LIYVPIDLDFSGSQIIYYEPERDYSDVEQSRAAQTIAPFRELKTQGEVKPIEGVSA